MAPSLSVVLGSFWWLLHPLHGNGYQFWSGIGSDLVYLGVIGAAVGWWRHHNCHVHRCWRLQWHQDPKHGHPVCRRHHPHARKCVPDPNGGTMLLEDD